ncbi:MAG: hypothetical protein RL593_468, partial [Pseudomonadota bacterium]
AVEGHLLTIHLTNIKNDQGNIVVELYSDSATFRKSAKALKIIKQPAIAGTVTVVFSGLDAGSYAVLTYHDEDGNNQMNKRFGMIPTEGYGLSNNPKVMGPPAFKDSEFQINQDLEINIQFNY